MKEHRSVWGIVPQGAALSVGIFKGQAYLPDAEKTDGGGTHNLDTALDTIAQKFQNKGHTAQGAGCLYGSLERRILSWQLMRRDSGSLWTLTCCP